MIESTSRSAAVDKKPFTSVLDALVGKAVTVINPESYEQLPVGYRLQVGFYTAKIASVEADHIVVITSFKRPGKTTQNDPVKQFIPLQQIKRVSLMEKECLIHL